MQCKVRKARGGHSDVSQQKALQIWLCMQTMLQMLLGPEKEGGKKDERIRMRIMA